MNSQIILANGTLPKSERQVRDGGRRSEERCIVSIATDQPSYEKNRNQIKNKLRFHLSYVSPLLRL